MSQNHSPVPGSRSIVGALVVMALAVAVPAFASWSHDAILNDAICTQAADQFEVRVATDGLGGWIVAWVDERGGGNPGIYAQRVNPSGSRAWATDGVLAYQTAGFFSTFELVGDGQGGAFLAIVDSQDALNYHVYLQRLTSGGARVSGTGGVAAVSGTGSAQITPSLVNTEPGEAVVVFQDSRTAGGDIYAQRMTSGGSLTWGSGGAAACTQSDVQANPRAIADGAGGVLVFWEDQRFLALSGSDVFGQRLSSAGTQLWTTLGATVTTAVNDQLHLAVTADGSGGAIIAWEDSRDYGANGLDIYAMRINAAGTARWFNNGLAVCALAGAQTAPVVAADPYGGAWFAWIDGRGDAWTGRQIYAQSLAGDGLAHWATGGVPAGPAAGEQWAPVLTATGDGGVSMVWTDQRTGAADIRGQRFDAAGAAQWGADGLLVSGAPFGQDGAKVAAGSGGEILAAWDDERLAQDIYAQRVDRTGWLGDPAPALLSAVDRPEDQGGQVRLTWSPSWLDAWGQPGLTAYHVLNRRPGVKAAGTGSEVLRAWLNDGWTEVAQVPPLQLASYGCNAPTYGDWTPSSQPLTEFMVVAEAGSFLLPSGVLSGYSVDNLSPGAPVNLQAETDHFDVLLAWQASGVDDADLHHYNVYRSYDPNFSPGSITLLSDAALTSYFEVRVPQGHWWFRVTAVDIHGNESSPSNVAGMLSLVAVDPNGLPATLAVRSATPNPFNPITEIRCDLPGDGNVTLDVYDLSGRAVRRLVDGARAAGTFAATWDGRDDRGRQVPSGIYFARLASGGTESVLKLVLAK